MRDVVCNTSEVEVVRHMLDKRADHSTRQLGEVTWAHYRCEKEPRCMINERGD